MKADNRYSENRNRKINLTNQPNRLVIFSIAIFTLIASRLFSLQILQGPLYRKLSEENRIRLVSSPPIRGRILDINGNILADSRLVHSLFNQPHLIKQP